MNANKRNQFRLTALGALVALSVTTATGCYWSVQYDSPPPTRVVVVEQPTPTRTTARKTTTTTTTMYSPSVTVHYDWVFYPTCDVYYNTATRVWVFYDHGRWVESYSLPGYYHARLGGRVVVEYNGSRPYTHVQAHRHHVNTHYRYDSSSWSYQRLQEAQYREHMNTYERSHQKPPTNHGSSGNSGHSGGSGGNRGGGQSSNPPQSSGPSSARPGPSNNYGANSPPAANPQGGDAGPSSTRPR